MACESGVPWKLICPDFRRPCIPRTKGVKCIGNMLTIGRRCEKGGLNAKTLIHELGHVLGLYHEMNRADRDEFIDILDGRLKKAAGYNFVIPKNHPMTLGTPYDYLSIMHYTQYAFTKKLGCATMKTKESCAQTIIGKTNVASFFDIKAVNTMYQCNRHCSHQDLLTWEQNGYGKCGDKDGCYLDRYCVCICPEKWMSDVRFLPQSHALFRHLPSEKECRKGNAPGRVSGSVGEIMTALLLWRVLARETFET